MVLRFCDLWVTHLVGMGFDFIKIVPLLLFCFGFFFVFGGGVFFLGCSNIHLSMIVQQLEAILLLLQEMSAHPSHSTILNWEPR